jgi:hypothetical protein
MVEVASLQFQLLAVKDVWVGWTKNYKININTNDDKQEMLQLQHHQLIVTRHDSCGA